MAKQLTGTTTVEMDPTSGELFITFPNHIAQAVGMDDWEWVNWDPQEDGTVVLTKSDGPDDEVAQGSSEES